MTLSQKTFFIFSSLTLAAVLLAGSLFYFVYGEARVHRIVGQLFVASRYLHDVERARYDFIDGSNGKRFRSFRERVSTGQLFLRNFLESKGIGKDVATQLRLLLFQLNNYEQAALELNDQYSEKARNREALRKIFSPLPDMLFQNKAQLEGVLTPPVIVGYRDLLEEILAKNAFDTFARARKLAAEIIERSPLPALTRSISKADRISQRLYVNWLAIQDRKAFLDATSGHFHLSILRALDSIDAGIRHSHRQRVLITSSISVLALLLALLFWLLVQRYFKAFLTSQEQVMGAIRAGESDIPLHFSPRDELGQLSGAFRDLAKEKATMENSLRRARNAAEAASMAKNEFLANMSHEIRTPLNGILGMLQLLEQTPLSGEQKEYTSAAIQSSRRLTGLLSDILDFSRVEAGKLEIHLLPFDFQEFFQSLHLLFVPAAMRKKLELRFEADPAIPKRLVGDAARLQQILGNLVGNAVKFTNTGRVEVLAQALASENFSRFRVLFCIRDTGVGIEDDRLEQLFAPFAQAETAYKRQYQGAGLGLSIAKQLTALLGGSLAVVSDPGVGTTFYLSMPFQLSDTREHAAAPGLEASPPEGLHILLAEDDDITKISTAMLLDRLGHRTTTAEDGRRALDVLQNDHFDLVLMDIQMPVMDGLEAARTIRAGRAGQENAAIPIVALTAYGMAGDREKFLAAGMSDYLAKPLEIDVLRSVLNKFRCRSE